MDSTAEAEKAFEYLVDLRERKSLVEVKQVSPKRSLSQNNYLHLLLSYFGNHFGYSVEEAKQIYKEINKSIYFYTKKGRTFPRSSADLTKEEMTASIELFRQKSEEAGLPLPTATDKGWLQEIENEIERSKYYLRSNV